MVVDPKPVYLSSLQLFRGLAALSVLVYHACLFTERKSGHILLGGWYHLGELGVDFFFVLSGFIITFVHVGELGQPAFAPRYLCRRFFRVYPLFFILTSWKIIMELISWQRGGAAPDLSRIISSYLLLPAPDGQMPVITAAWTLMHEALFYALFLLALLLGRRPAIIILGGWMAFILMFSINGLELHGLPALIFDAHNVEFVFGITACLIFQQQKRLRFSPVWMAVCALVALVAGCLAYNPSGGMEQPINVRLFMGAGFGMLILSVGTWEQSLQNTPWPKWTCWFGDASYSIYLGHSLLVLAVISIGSRYFPGSEVARYLVALLATIAALVACGLLWMWVERPLLRWSRRWCR